MESYTAPQPARFYSLPDGTPSSVQMVVGADGQPRPLEVKSPQQLEQWDKIQAARPLTSVEQQTRLNASLARPIADPKSATDTLGAGRDWLAQRRFEAEAEAATEATALAAPRSKAEEQERGNAAAQLAAKLGCQLVYVPVTDALGNPPHMELRPAGIWGDLVTIEKALAAMARERDRRDRQIADYEAYRERQRAEAAERIADLPENRLARLEAALAERGIDPAPLTVVHGSLPGV